jgi:hypothetical protein
MDNYRRQLFAGTTAFAPGKLLPVTNYDNPTFKPRGGLWTSALRADGESAWTMFCKKADFDIAKLKTYTVLAVLPTAKLYRIDTLADLQAIAELEPRLKMWGHIDFEKLARSYDGIYLSEQGLAANRTLDCLSQPLNLNTWDVECTLWFRNVFTIISSETKK